MRNKMIKKSVVAICAVGLGLMACGCDKASDNEKAAIAPVTSEETTDTVTEQATQATNQEAAETTTEAIASSADDTIQYSEVAGECIGALNKMEIMCAGGISMDYETSITFDNGNRASLVTDSEFSSTKDIADFARSYATEAFINERYSGLLETGEDGLFMDIEEGNEYGVPAGLYAVEAGRGCYQYSAADITISDVTENSFTSTSTFENFGAQSVLTLKFTLTDGKWLMSDMEIQE